MEPLNQSVISFLKMFKPVCDVVAWCFKYDILPGYEF